MHPLHFREHRTFFAEAIAANRRGGRVAAGRVGAAFFQRVAHSVAALGLEVFPVWHELRERRPALLRPGGWGCHRCHRVRLRSRNGLNDTTLPEEKNGARHQNNT